MDSVGASIVLLLFVLGMFLLMAGKYLVWRGKVSGVQEISHPPAKCGTAEFSYRLKSGVDDDTASSLIYDWARGGYISIVQHRDGGFTIRRRKQLEESRPDVERRIYRVLFESGNGENSVHSSRIALVCKEASGLIHKAVQTSRRACRPKWRYHITHVLFGLSCALAVFCVLWLGAMRKVLLNPKFQFIDMSVPSVERYMAAISDVWPSMLVFSIQVLALLVILYKVLVWIRPKWVDMRRKTRAGAVLFTFVCSLVLMGGVFLSCYGLYIDNDTDATLTMMNIILSFSGLCCVFAGLFPFCDTVGQPMEKLWGYYRFLSSASSEELKERFTQEPDAFSACFAYAVSMGGGQMFLRRCEGISIAVPQWFSADDGVELTPERFLRLLSSQAAYLKVCFQSRKPPEDVVNHKNPMWRETKTG